MTNQVRTQKINLFDGIELKSAIFQGRDFPAHFHDSFAITVIEKGCERVTWQEKEMVQYAHSVSIINPFEVHANRYFDDDAWHYKTFYLNRDAMRFLLGEKVHFSNQIIEDVHFANALLQFHTENTFGKSSNNLNSLLPFFKIYNIENHETTKNKFQYPLEDIAAYIRTNFSEKVNIDALAQRCHTDKFKFIRAFKATHGITPISYLLLYRVNHAKKLLHSNMPLTQAALESGFYDQSHFIHCFKKYVGVTPSSYKMHLEV